MDTMATHRDEFLTLREEIRATKARLFWILIIGLIGVPLLTYVAAQAEFYVWLVMPYSVLLLIIVFLAEQSSMMRAGRYIREHIESQGKDAPHWEGWIESRPQFRLADRHYVACFLIVFFLYYFMTVGVAMKLIMDKEAADMSGERFYRYWLYGAVVTYAIGAVWALATLITHWRSTVSTTSKSG